LTEGVVGVPRFINPILAVSEADKDLTALVYSGLMKVGKNGLIEKDLAKTIEKSDDGLEYTIKIRDDAFFHDGTKVTADDVLFTIKTALNPDIRSPRRPAWEGVKVEKIDTYTVKFKLSTPYDLFLENTTIGILPSHIWQNVSPQEFQFYNRNINPIGSGPYLIKKVIYDKSNSPKTYILQAFNNYKPHRPYISIINLKFYSSEEKAIEDLQMKKIESLNAVSPENAKKLEKLGYKVDSIIMPRIFGAFFNQNKNQALNDIYVRKALKIATNRQELVDEVLLGYGSITEHPIPNQSFENSEPLDLQNSTTTQDLATTTDVISQASAMLEKGGWAKNSEGIWEKKKKNDTLTLAFSISTANVPELKRGAEVLKRQWEKVGARVDLKIFELSDLKQNVIRPREFEVLFFGQVLGRNPDLFVYWHSSQRNDPGLNIVSYVNKVTDKILESIRKGLNKEAKEEGYKTFISEIQNDVPAIFLYSPDFLYVLPEKVKGFSMSLISTPEERFHNVTDWYIDTENILKIFKKIKE
jgi:peptide/nickel transport system substrate-binding protein